VSDVPGPVPTQGHMSSPSGVVDMVPRESAALLGSSAVEVGGRHRISTQSQHGSSKPKLYTDETIRYSLLISVGEPTSIHEALGTLTGRRP
jgi:hypothetical protein